MNACPLHPDRPADAAFGGACSRPCEITIGNERFRLGYGFELLRALVSDGDSDDSLEWAQKQARLLIALDDRLRGRVVEEEGRAA